MLFRSFGFIYPSDTPDDLIDTWKSYLDKLLAVLEEDGEAIYVGVDAARPNNEKYQATAGAVLFRNKSLINASRHTVGRVTSAEAELAAICTGVEVAVRLQSTRIIIFTDSIAQARRAVDPSAHSGQPDSLRACRALRMWFGQGTARHITFVWVPSKLEWGPHHEAHKYLREFPLIPGRELR